MNEPNELTKQAMMDTRAGIGVTRYDSLEAMLTALDIPEIAAAKHPLQQLREEFESERDSFMRYARMSADTPITIEEAIKMYENILRVSHGHVDRIDVPMIELAIRYSIARDFGEFDCKKALMLWKLQKS